MHALTANWRLLGFLFEQPGVVLVPEVRVKLLDAWGIDAGVRVGEFSREQNAFLEYHRVNVFKHTLLER